LKEIELSKIEGNNTRFATANIQDISKSFESYGQFSPIRIKKKHSTKEEETYEVVFGNRRLATARALGWRTILADVVEVSEDDALIMAFSENEDRANFTDYEKAILIERLHALSGKTYAEIAEILGKSSSYISQHIAMLHLFTEDEEASEQDRKIVLQQLTEKHARTLLRIEDPFERWTAAKLVVKCGMGVRELENMIARKSKRSSLDMSRSNSKERITQIIKSHIASMNSRDIASYFEPVSKNHFTKFSCYPPLSRLDSNSASEQLFHMLHELRDYEAAIESSELRVVGNFAYALLTLRNKYANSQKAVIAEMRLTIIFERDHHDWKIVHEHWSSATPSKFLSLFTKQELR
jgi:ParB family transcriptional regulator, chromosome partitioning protein